MGPQLENGYTKIADAILENMSKAKLNGTQFRILLIVWRSTYGWGKKAYALSESYLAEATGINKRQIKRELKEMIELGVLIETKAPSHNSTREIQFNKHYLHCDVVTKKTPGDGLDTSTGDLLDTSTGGLLDTSRGDGLDTQNRDIKKHINIQDKESSFAEIRKEFKGTKSLSAAMKKLPNLIKKYGKEKLIASVKNYNQYVDRERKNGFAELKYLNESTFWNGRFLDYIEEEIKPKKENKPLQWETRYNE